MSDPGSIPTTEFAALAGAMTAVGTVVGFYVRKITGPRFATLETKADAVDRAISDLSTALAAHAARIEAVDDSADKRSAMVREVMGGKDKEIHDRIDVLKETIGSMREEIGYLRGKSTRRNSGAQ